MAKQNTNPKKGFTIIEVVLVLAIAGLIFLMVFIAWPALQRSQKDTQRRDDYAMLSTAISNYITNNNGKLTNLGKGGASLDPSTYINKEGLDPDGYAYELLVYNTDNDNTIPTPTNIRTRTEAFCSNGAATTKDACAAAGGEWTEATGGDPTSQVFVVVKADCGGTDGTRAIPQKNTSSRSFAIYGYLEGGTQTFCSDSQ